MRTLFILVCLTSLSACSLFSGEAPPEEEEEKPTELSKPTSDLPEAELLATAKSNFRSGLFSVAKESFENLRNNFPLGPYAEFSEIKAADTRFEEGDFPGAATVYEDFVKNRPASASVPWAMLRAGHSHELANKGVGRDPASLNKAEEWLNRLIKEYPASVYTPAAQAYLVQVRNALAAHDKSVIDFYRRKEKPEALVPREQQFEQRYGMKVDDFVWEENPEEIQIAAIPPEDRKGLQQIALADQPSDQLATAPAAAAASTPQSPAALAATASKGNPVRQIVCEADKGLAFLHLGASYADASFIDDNRYVRLNGSNFDLQFPGLTTQSGEKLTADCFGKDDVSVSPDGTVKIETKAAAARVFALTNPPRILVSFR